MTQAAASVLLVVFFGAAAWWDASVNRIPNSITVTGLAAALILRAPLGVESLLQGVGGFGLALLISVPLFALRAIGGGDAKLLAAVGAFTGSSHVMGAMGLIAVLGAAYAVVSISARGLLPLLALNTLDLVKSWLSLGRTGERRKLETSAALTIPYGIPIAMGTLICWFGKGIRL